MVNIILGLFFYKFYEYNIIYRYFKYLLYNKIYYVFKVEDCSWIIYYYKLKKSLQTNILSATIVETIPLFCGKEY